MMVGELCPFIEREGNEMRNAIAYRVSRDYCDYGATGLYVVQRQDPVDLNWKSCAWYGDESRANYIAFCFAKLHGVVAFDLGGYELKGAC